MATTIELRKFIRGDTERRIFISTGMSLVGYTPADLTIKVRRPDLTTFTLTSDRTIVDAEDGIVSVDTEFLHFNQNGEYLVQVRAAAAGLPDKRSLIGSFFVDDDVALGPEGGFQFAGSEVPNWTLATPEQRARYAFWTDSAGLNPDGSPGATWS